MKKKTSAIFLSLILVLMFGLTGCSNDKGDGDMLTDDNNTKTEDERIGDSGNLNQGVVEPGDEGVVGDATDAGDAGNANGTQNNNANAGSDKNVKDEIKDGVDDMVPDKDKSNE